MKPSPPTAIRWYRWFCFASVVVNLVLAWICASSPEFGPQRWPDVPNVAWTVFAGVVAPFGLFLAVMNAVFVMLPVRPWAYAVHLANLALTACGCVFAPLCAPMLIAFRGPEVQRYFGIEPH